MQEVGRGRGEERNKLKDEVCDLGPACPGLRARIYSRQVFELLYV